MLRAMDDTDIERELRDAQAATKAIEGIRLRRQEAVVKALDNGWKSYRIAKVLGVTVPTVDAIIRAAKKGSD